MKCPDCEKQMNIAEHKENRTLWKCSYCGHMTLVQDWDRDDVGGRAKEALDE